MSLYRKRFGVSNLTILEVINNNLGKSEIFDVCTHAHRQEAQLSIQEFQISWLKYLVAQLEKDLKASIPTPECQECGGMGILMNSQCHDCNGTGLIQKVEVDGS